jgi:hypothetical protein
LLKFSWVKNPGQSLFGEAVTFELPLVAAETVDIGCGVDPYIGGQPKPKPKPVLVVDGIKDINIIYNI